MLVEDADSSKLCFEYILQLSCCPRCALRFIGEDTLDNYTKPVQQIVSAYGSGESGDSVGNQADSVCVACLGILQHRYCQESFCLEVANISKKADFEFTDYFITISTPVSLLLREHAIWVCLAEKFPHIYKREVRDKIISTKEVWRWYNTDSLNKHLSSSFNAQSSYLISLNFEHPMIRNECNFLLDVLPGVFKSRKRNKHGWEVFNRTNVSKAIADLSFEKFKSNYSCPPRALSMPCDCDPIMCSTEAIFVAGRYNKYSRTLSQTEWIVDGKRKTESSIEELIKEPLQKHIKAEQMRFSCSGREDVDVKMLGDGRPFLFECINPHRNLFTQTAMNKMQEEINNSTTDIAVRNLQIVSKEETGRLKEGEADKIKCYSAVCWSERSVSQTDMDKLDKLQELTIKQKTPVRVIHRRPVAVREKVIHKMSGKLLNDHHFVLKMDTQAGTYVKEFVHGDFGRTTPNLSSLLGTDCDILQLDVEAVLLDWPKKVDLEAT